MFISMWISNTAATAMMIPIMETVLVELEAVSPFFFFKTPCGLGTSANQYFKLIFSKDSDRCLFKAKKRPKRMEKRKYLSLFSSLVKEFMYYFILSGPKDRRTVLWCTISSQPMRPVSVVSVPLLEVVQI